MVYDTFPGYSQETSFQSFLIGCDVPVWFTHEQNKGCVIHSTILALISWKFTHSLSLVIVNTWAGLKVMFMGQSYPRCYGGVAKNV